MANIEVFSYEKLVLPRDITIKSDAWIFFGLPADENGIVVTTNVMICILCQEPAKYRDNKYNDALKHVKDKHAEEYEGRTPMKFNSYPRDISGKFEVMTVNNKISVFNVKLTIDQLRINDEPQEDAIEDIEICDPIAEFIINDLHAPEFIEELGFKKLLGKFIPISQEIPNKDKLENDIIPRIYNHHRQSVLTTLTEMDNHFSLSFEEWKSKSDRTYITIEISYCDQSPLKLRTRYLETIHVLDFWDENIWITIIDDFMFKWNLNNTKMVAALMASRNDELENALKKRNLVVIPCFVFILQSCIQQFLLHCDIHNLLHKIRMTISFFVNSKVSFEEEELPIEEMINLMTNYKPQFWVSTYYIIKQILENKEVFENAVEMYETTTTNTEITNLADEDWKNMENIQAVLFPIEEAIKELRNHDSKTISALSGMMQGIIIYLRGLSNVEDNESLSSSAGILHASLLRYYSDEVKLSMSIARILDPSIKQPPPENDKDVIWKHIQNLLFELTGGETGELELRPEKSKKRPTSPAMMLRGHDYEDECTNSPKTKIDAECTQYQNSKISTLPPLQTWETIRNSYPLLYKLVDRYHCIPGCCVSPDNISTKMIIYHERRAALPSNLIDKLLFLHKNMTWYSD